MKDELPFPLLPVSLSSPVEQKGKNRALRPLSVGNFSGLGGLVKSVNRWHKAWQLPE